MNFVTSGYIQRIFLKHDKKTILRRPNIRRFAMQYNVPHEIHEKAWLIHYDDFMAKIIPKEFPEEKKMDRIRTLDVAIAQYNRTRKTMLTDKDIQLCLNSGKVFYYQYHGKTIVNFDQLKVELDKRLKPNKKTKTPKGKNKRNDP